jgi:hypothetical protein
MIDRKTLCAAALLSCLSLPAMAASAQKPEQSMPAPAYDTKVIPGKIMRNEPAGRPVMASPSLESELLSAQLPRPAGIVSGPAYGTNVIPSTALQKLTVQKVMTEGRSVSSASSAMPRAEIMGALVAVGAPGIEGSPDTQSGPDTQSRQ